MANVKLNALIIAKLVIILAKPANLGTIRIWDLVKLVMIDVRPAGNLPCSALLVSQDSA